MGISNLNEIEWEQSQERKMRKALINDKIIIEAPMFLDKGTEFSLKEVSEPDKKAFRYFVSIIYNVSYNSANSMWE